jgi:hypothetical protein
VQANALKTLAKKTINKKWHFAMNLNGSARFLFGEEGENEQQIADLCQLLYDTTVNELFYYVYLYEY